MHRGGLESWQHSHSFDQHLRKPGEFRTLIVIALTATMMVVEIVAGRVFGSMALPADGLHMASQSLTTARDLAGVAFANAHALLPNPAAPTR